MMPTSSLRTCVFFPAMHKRMMFCNGPYGIVWSYPDLGKEEVSAMILSRLSLYISGYFPSITPAWLPYFG